ncbi:hypothetical protein GW17_00006557 [Ensete ventricosum]|uniref:Uncharacterized protein n=1 Tax=Ensete ventricosum TaxID=4639 RepID=A0A444G226_ENSVE|nr:hypothetical protein B296_00010537 [Ensete ventricosum]RWW28944.1 hypothetical protein GW17_00006557 [Ensete ventricosum]
MVVSVRLCRCRCQRFKEEVKPTVPLRGHVASHAGRALLVDLCMSPPCGRHGNSFHGIDALIPINYMPAVLNESSSTDALIPRFPATFVADE